MIVYKSTKESFTSDVETGAVEDVIEAKYNAALNRGVSKNEKRSWQNSMMYMNTVLTDYEIPQDAGSPSRCRFRKHQNGSILSLRVKSSPGRITPLS